jgi:transcriptional regulator with XRE-family HTH domain
MLSYSKNRVCQSLYYVIKSDQGRETDILIETNNYLKESMGRSQKISRKFIQKAKASVQRQGYARQKDLAEELNMSITTVSNFLNGKPVDSLNFIELCKSLGLDEKVIVDINASDSNNSAIIVEDVSPLQVVESYEDFIYIERPLIESLCYETLLKSGSLLRIKSPGWMGKTSLIAKILPQLEKNGYRTVYLNLHSAEINDFNNLDTFLKWLSICVSRALGLPHKFTDYWVDEFCTPKINCTAYFEEYLLSQADTPLLLCLDEVDRIFPYTEVATDFLGLLRVWHEKAKISFIWKKLRLVVVHSTEVYVPLRANESPFNVGILVELPEFTLEQVQNLAQKYGLNWSLDEVKQLMDLVGGHPYLLGRTCSYLKLNSNVTLSQLLLTAATEMGIFSSYLRHYWNMIELNKDLATTLQKVLTEKGDIFFEPTHIYKLYSMGLVKLMGNEVRITCNLYHQYFSRCFGISL